MLQGELPWLGRAHTRTDAGGRFGASFFTAPIALAGQAFGAQYLYAFYWTFYALFGMALLAHRPQTVGETFFSLVLAVLGLVIAVGLVAEVVNLLRVMVTWARRGCGAGCGTHSCVQDSHRARWMEAQQRLNFSQKRKEVQQWLRAMVNSEPLFHGAEPAVIHSLAMRCKFKARRASRLLLSVLTFGAGVPQKRGVRARGHTARRGAVHGPEGSGGRYVVECPCGRCVAHHKLTTAGRVAARHACWLSGSRGHLQH